MAEQTELNLPHIVRKPASAYGETEAGVPGLLLLHGRGADEADLLGLVPALDPRLVVVSVRAPFRFGPGYAWYGMPQTGTPERDSLHTSLDELREFIEGRQSLYGIDRQRLFLLGFSQGAVMSAALALTMPESVRGIVMHSGYVPTESGLDTQAGALRAKPFFVAHGLYDEIITIKFGRQSRDFLISEEADLSYKEYPIAHSISEESLYDLSEWLTRQVDSTTS